MFLEKWKRQIFRDRGSMPQRPRSAFKVYIWLHYFHLLPSGMTSRFRMWIYTIGLFSAEMVLTGVRSSERPFVGLYSSPINFCSVPAHFYYGICVCLLRCVDWIRKGEGHERPALLCSARRWWPLFLLRRWPRCSCSMVHSAVDGHRALLLPMFHRARPATCSVAHLKGSNWPRGGE
jgi:hypothetical protein